MQGISNGSRLRGLFYPESVPMRRARWLILAAITIIVFALGSTYYARLARLAKDAPAAPKALKPGMDATAEGWHFRKTDDKKRGPNGEPCPVVEVTAKSFVSR